MTIESIFVASRRGDPQAEVDSVRVVAGKGIQGDRNFGKVRQPSTNITFVEAEALERFCDVSGLMLDLSASRRNVVTRGVRLNGFVGREFVIGEARFRGVELCEPCSKLGSRLATDALPAQRVVRLLVHRAGLRATVITTGTIRVGDAIVMV